VPRGRRLRLLVAHASDLPGLPTLAGGGAAVIDRALGEARGRGRLRTDFNIEALGDPVTAASLDSALETTCDIFEFSGHRYSRRRLDGGEQAGIAVSDGNGGVAFLPAERLAASLSRSSVRVVLLNACGPDDPLDEQRDELASHFLRAGIPAVIAMQFRVDDSHAIAFSEGFYASLATGASLDEAVSVGRRRMHGLGILTNWGAPAVYTRSADGLIFPEAAAPSHERRDDRERPHAPSFVHPIIQATAADDLVEPHIREAITRFCSRWQTPLPRDERDELTALMERLHTSPGADGDAMRLLSLLNASYPHGVKDHHVRRNFGDTSDDALGEIRNRAEALLKKVSESATSQFAVAVEVSHPSVAEPVTTRKYFLRRMPISTLLERSPDAHVGLPYDLRFALSLYDAGHYLESVAQMTGIIDLVCTSSTALSVPELALFLYYLSKSLLKLNWYAELEMVLDGPYQALSRSVLRDLEVERLQVAGTRFRQLGDYIAAQACFDGAVDMIPHSSVPAVLRRMGDCHAMRAQSRLDQAVRHDLPDTARIASLRTARTALNQAVLSFDALRESTGTGTHYEGRLHGTLAFLDVATSLVTPEAMTSDQWRRTERHARMAFEPSRERKPFGVVAGRYALAVVNLAEARWHALAGDEAGLAAAAAPLESAVRQLRELFEHYLARRVNLGVTFELAKLRLTESTVVELSRSGAAQPHLWRQIGAISAIWSPLA
jgi:hypothetical protein